MTNDLFDDGRTSYKTEESESAADLETYKTEESDLEKYTFSYRFSSMRGDWSMIRTMPVEMHEG